MFCGFLVGKGGGESWIEVEGKFCEWDELLLWYYGNMNFRLKLVTSEVSSGIESVNNLEERLLSGFFFINILCCSGFYGVVRFDIVFVIVSCTFVFLNEYIVKYFFFWKCYNFIRNLK